MLITSDLPIVPRRNSSSGLHLRFVDGCLLLVADGQIACWAECFEHLFMLDPHRGQLQIARIQTLDANPPTDVKENIPKLRDGETAGICNISAKLLKDGSETMIRGLHAVLTAVWH